MVKTLSNVKINQLIQFEKYDKLTISAILCGINNEGSLVCLQNAIHKTAKK